MWRVLKFLFTGDWHICKWERKGEIYKAKTQESPERDVGWIYECAICGKPKAFKPI